MVLATADVLILCRR